MKWFDDFFEKAVEARCPVHRGVAPWHAWSEEADAGLRNCCCRYCRSTASPGPPAEKPKKINGKTSCEYWRHCALDGFICSCCGGSVSSCPPPTEVSKVTWVGTCHPNDGRDYLISYNGDCCGVTMCGQCFYRKATTRRNLPGYHAYGVPATSSWCMASSSSTYHCTVAAIVGVAGGRADHAGCGNCIDLHHRHTTIFVPLPGNNLRRSGGPEQSRSMPGIARFCPSGHQPTARGAQGVAPAWGILSARWHNRPAQRTQYLSACH